MNFFQTIENSKLVSRKYVLLWPEICGNESEVAQKFISNAAPYLRKLSLNSDVYILFPVQNGSSSDSLVVILEGYSVSNTFIINKLRMKPDSHSLNWWYLLNKIDRRKNSREAILRAISVVRNFWLVLKILILMLCFLIKE